MPRKKGISTGQRFQTSQRHDFLRVAEPVGARQYWRMTHSENTARTTSDAPTVLRVEGEIDMSNSEELRRQFVEALDGGARTVVLDLSEVTFFASSGIAALAHAREYGKLSGDRPVHVVASRSVRRSSGGRTGSEGRISSLKRGYGWDRTHHDGLDWARIWTGQAVPAHTASSRLPPWRLIDPDRTPPTDARLTT